MATDRPERDPKALAQQAFRGAERLLSSAEIIERHATGLDEITRALVEACRPERRDARICELGFGSGWLLEELVAAYPGASLYGLDLSPGVTSHGREQFGGRVHIARGDMEQLPFAGESFDTVATCWTLYFMRDIDAALEEIKRPLRVGGRLVAATVAPDHMRGFDELDTAAFAALGQEADPGVSDRFDLETGLPYMERHFPRVERREWYGELVLPDAETAVRFWELLWSTRLAGDVVERVRPEFARLAAALAAREGGLRFSRHGGAFVGYNEG